MKKIALTLALLTTTSAVAVPNIELNMDKIGEAHKAVKRVSVAKTTAPDLIAALGAEARPEVDEAMTTRALKPIYEAALRAHQPEGTDWGITNLLEGDYSEWEGRITAALKGKFSTQLDKVNALVSAGSPALDAYAALVGRFGTSHKGHIEASLVQLLAWKTEDAAAITTRKAVTKAMIDSGLLTIGEGAVDEETGYYAFDLTATTQATVKGRKISKLELGSEGHLSHAQQALLGVPAEGYAAERTASSKTFAKSTLRLHTEAGSNADVVVPGRIEAVFHSADTYKGLAKAGVKVPVIADFTGTAVYESNAALLAMRSVLKGGGQVQVFGVGDQTTRMSADFTAAGFEYHSYDPTREVVTFRMSDNPSTIKLPLNGNRHADWTPAGYEEQYPGLRARFLTVNGIDDRHLSTRYWQRKYEQWLSNVSVSKAEKKPWAPKTEVNEKA